jgi:hypothetical protein
MEMRGERPLSQSLRLYLTDGEKQTAVLPEIIEALARFLPEEVDPEDQVSVAKATFASINELIRCFPQGTNRKINVIRSIFEMIESESEKNHDRLVEERDRCKLQLDQIMVLKRRSERILTSLNRIRPKNEQFWTSYARPMIIDGDKDIQEGYSGTEFLQKALENIERVISSLGKDIAEAEKRLAYVKSVLVRKGHWLDPTKDTFHYVINFLIRQPRPIWLMKPKPIKLRKSKATEPTKTMAVKNAADLIARIIFNSKLKQTNEYRKVEIKKWRRGLRRSRDIGTAQDFKAIMEDLDKDALRWLTLEIEKVYKRQKQAYPDRYTTFPDLDRLDRIVPPRLKHSKTSE